MVDNLSCLKECYLRFKDKHFPFLWTFFSLKILMLDFVRDKRSKKLRFKT